MRAAGITSQANSSFPLHPTKPAFEALQTPVSLESPSGCLKLLQIHTLTVLSCQTTWCLLPALGVSTNLMQTYQHLALKNFLPITHYVLLNALLTSFHWDLL